MFGILKRKHAANGGMITGPGTGTSDSIEKDVPEGTYIMPADSTVRLGLSGIREHRQEAEQPKLGMQGFRKEVPVAVSNGEYELPPEQVHAVGAAVLDQAKDATHKPVGLGMNKAALEAYRSNERDGPRQFFAEGGQVARGAPGYKGGSAKPAKADAPRLGIRGFANGGVVDDDPRQDSAGISRMLGGAAGLPVAAGLDIANVAGTAAANLGRRAIGGETLPHPGMPRTAALATQTAEGARDFAQANTNLVGGIQRGLRGAFDVPEAGAGATPAAARAERLPGQVGGAPMSGQRIQQMAREAVPRPGATRSSQAAAPQTTTQNPDQPPAPLGNGYTQAGNDIAMKQGADGTYEFTNDQAAVSGARMMPEGGMGRVGDGVGGGLSVGEPGDAQLALDRFARANDIRAETIRENRGSEIGDNGGRVTGLYDSSRAPSNREILAQRSADRREALDQGREQLRRQNAAADMQEARAAAQEGRQATTAGLEQQRLQQQIDEGNLGMQDRQRIDQLRAQINDPNLTEQQRAQALDAYNALSITPDSRLKAQQEASSQQQRLISDLYKSFSGLQTPPTTGEGNNARPMSFEEWLQPALRAIQGGGQQGQQSARTSVTRAEVEQTARARGISPDEVIRRLQGVGVTVNG